MCLYYQDNAEAAFNHFQHVLRLAPDHQKAREIYKVRALFIAIDNFGVARDFFFGGGGLHLFIKFIYKILIYKTKDLYYHFIYGQ